MPTRFFASTQRLAGSVGVALFTAYFTERIRVTGSAILALHDSAVVLSVWLREWARWVVCGCAS